MEKIRPLRATDKDDVLEIARNTWEGHDWLPSYFDSWLDDSTCNTIAIEVDNRVAALANLKLIEEGKTGWMEGLRVHPDHRGKGYATVITNHLVEMARRLNVKRLRYTTANDNFESIHLASKIGMSQVFTQGVYYDSNIDQIEWDFGFERLKQLDVEKNHGLIESSNLIPNSILVLDWKAYDATIDGFKSFGDIQVWSRIEKNQLASISIGSLRHVMNGPVWSFTIYSDQENLFLEQLSKHISLAREISLNRIMMIFPFRFYEQLYGLEWVERGEFDFGVILFEKIL